MKSILSAVIGATLALCVIEADAGTAAGEKKVAIEIESSSLADALDRWAQQTGFQIVVQDWELAKQFSAPSLKGTFSAQAALERLLSGTSFTYFWLDERAVSIRRKTPQTVPTSLQRTALDEQQALPVANPSGDDFIGTSENRPPSEAVDDSELNPRPEKVEEVIVTGSHIHGNVAAGTHIQILDREAMDRTGYSTVQDVLNNAVPQVVGGGPSEDFNTGRDGNFNLGSGVNLRGLGADATLVLVNGRRQALGGTEGGFVDVSSIPVSAVKKIEILADGASALYGSDAIGGVVNIVLRDDYQGAETRARWGTAEGGARERTISQALGRSWTGGNAIVGIHLSDRDSLTRTDRSYTKSEDQRRFGGDDFRSYTGNPGNILDPETFAPAFAIPAGQDGSALQVEDLVPGTVHLYDSLEGADLLPQQRSQVAFFNAVQDLGGSIRLSADGRFARRKVEQVLAPYTGVLFVTSSNPFFLDPFGDSPYIPVGYSFTDDLGPLTARGDTDTFSGGLSLQGNYGHGWRAQVSVGYGKEKLTWDAINVVDFSALDIALADPDPTTAFNPFGDGSHTNPRTLDAIRTSQHERADSTVQTVSLVTDGTLVTLPSGPVKVALGLDGRRETLDRGTETTTELDRDVTAAFAEIALPLVDRVRARSKWRQRLELSVAARYEDYSDFGNTTNPRVGLSWSPHESFALRGTWGTSFKAPRLADLVEGLGVGTGSSLFPIPDPESPLGFSNILGRFGNNADLTQEKAESWTAGLDLSLWGDLEPTLSLTYFRTRYKDRIAAGGPPDVTAVLLLEDEWAEIIQRDPSQAAIDEICNSDAYFGDPGQCMTTPIGAIVDFRLRNLGMVEIEGVDAQFSHAISTKWGEFGFGVDSSYILHFQRAVTRSAAVFDVVDTVGNPPSFRIRGNLSWQSNSWGTGVYLNYVDDYTDNASVPERRISSWTTLDFRTAYVTQPGSSLWDGVEVALSVTNAFDRMPPFTNTVNGYDAANAELLGRVIGIQFSKTW